MSDGSIGPLVMYNARIMFKNFAGREGKFNQEGDRNFCLALDPETAQNMRADGWNIKTLPVRDEGDVPQDYVPVSLKYRGKNGSRMNPPTVVYITSQGRTDLPEEMVEIFDQIDIANVDLIIRAHEWAVNGKSGVKAYLQSIYVTAREDELALKYRDVARVGVDQAEQQLAIESGPSGRGDIVDGESWYDDDEPGPSKR